MIDFPNKKYKIIYADPPWSYNNKSLGGNYNAGASSHYDTLDLKSIKQLPISTICDKNCMLFLWAVVPQLPEAFQVLESWGFKYKTTITWYKLSGSKSKMGLGYWFRGCTEHLLFAVKGNVKAFRCQRPNIITQDSKGHSKKPNNFRKLIEIATNNLQPRIELFARTRIHGWDTWGNDEKLENSPLEAFVN